MVIGGSPIIRSMPVAEPYAYRQQRQPYRRPAVPQRQPTVRAQTPAPAKPKPKPEPIVMPSPEELGLRIDPPAPAPARTAEDWLPLLRRLDSYGMTRFEFAPQGGGFRFACELPGPRKIQVVGASKLDVLEKALAKVESGTTH